ncbi:MAG TPA: hypothetical protein VGK47_06610 [Nitrososphaeraceae archaeon]
MERYFNLFLIIAVVSCSQGTKPRDKQTIKDSLNGTYVEIIREGGVLVQANLYANYKLERTDVYRNGQLFDRVQFDSLGNVTSHDPILIWENSNNKDADTLVLKIKNVDSLTYYQCFFTASELEFDFEASEKIKNIRPVDSRMSPVIKVPRTLLTAQNKLFVKWGYLVSVKDSANTAIHQWEHFDEVFEFK